jgi:hypothetical protein
MVKDVNPAASRNEHAAPHVNVTLNGEHVDDDRTSWWGLARALEQLEEEPDGHEPEEK